MVEAIANEGERLAIEHWIRAHHNLHLTGPTGTGKSWLACALGQQSLSSGSFGAL
jgi:DNA replication protein DnaC